MKKKTFKVRIFLLDPTSPPVDIDSVVRAETWDGLYRVKQSSGLAYRFPIAQISMITETPPA